jgi:hypothetical protein
MPDATVNLQKNYSSLNEKLAKLFDESGVRRSFTVPYIEGQAMADHITAVGTAASQNGGLTGNMLTSGHHADGKGYGSGDGKTVGHPAEKLRQTIIPKDDKNAEAVIAAAQKCVTDFKFLLGENDPDAQTAQGHLNLVKKTNGAGMNLFDFGVLMIQMMLKPSQAIARAHSGTKQGGHAAHLRGPEAQQAQEQPEQAQGGAQGQEQAPTDQTSAPAAQGPPAAAPAPEQAQG